jgi:hypothetical protein
VKAPTAIVAAVVGQDARDADAAASKPVEGALQKGRRGGARLIRQDLDIGGPTVVIDGDVRILGPDPFTDARRSP